MMDTRYLLDVHGHLKCLWRRVPSSDHALSVVYRGRGMYGVQEQYVQSTELADLKHWAKTLRRFGFYSGSKVQGSQTSLARQQVQPACDHEQNKSELFLSKFSSHSMPAEPMLKVCPNNKIRQ